MTLLPPFGDLGIGGGLSCFGSGLVALRCAALVSATRIVRFERLLRDTLPASTRLQQLAFEVTGKLGIRRVPDVRYVDCIDVPMVWCAVAARQSSCRCAFPGSSMTSRSA